jgi:predicted short-subunit dehydrogenase-like oxidoreductase (DUF2520 family)
MDSFEVADEDRAAYHAAASIAANFLVTLEGAAERLAATAGVPRAALAPLVRAAVDNWAALGARDALTGPIVRGDAGTVRKHLGTLPQELLELYVANARRTLARAVAAGRLDAVRAKALGEALEEALVR